MSNFKHYYFMQRVLIITLFFACLTPLSLLAQTIQLTGTVSDSKGEVLIGASVLEKGTTNGCITDLDGNFTLNVQPNATMVISYVGYISQEIALNGQKNLKVVLKDDSEMLDEVVVIGYGTMKKSDMTGAISSVKSEELMKRATTSATEALQGKVAGVSILRSGGNAGASISVKIRGIKTMGSNEPLYIIDGYPGDINTINPQDIESMEILKDGAAAAIYGSVAANGVVLVTTKNGKEGELKISFNTYMTVNQAAKKFDMLDANGYLQVHNMMYENANEKKPAYLTHKNGANPTGADTDWQDEMLRTGIAQNYYVNLIGGSNTAKYSLSYGHADEKGIFKGNSYIQDNARLKLNVHKYIFDFDAGLNFKVTQSKQPQYSLKEMYSITPLVPVYDESQTYGYGLTDMSVDGVFMQFPTNRNIMADDHYRNRKYTGYDITGNIGLTMKFAPWLTFKTSYTYNGYYYNDRYHRDKYEANKQEPNLYPYNYEYNSYYYQQTFENVLTFMKDFGKHSVTAMAGTSVIATRSDYSSVSVEGKKTIYEVENGNLVSSEVPGGFFDPHSPTIDAGNGGTYVGSGSFYDYNRASFFGRLNYSYDSRYLVQVTVRADGSSKFGKNNRWGTFPSVALGWRISEEAFFPKNDILTNLKLRASWGRLGSESALGYYYAPTMTNSNTQWMSYIQGGNPWLGMSNLYLVNDDLRWETTDTKNFGFDFGLFNNKLNGTINYYYNTTEDLLIEKVMAPSAGIYNPTVNVGKMVNRGFELELNYGDSFNGFDYNIGFNLSTIHNEMKKADPNQILYGSAWKGEGHFVTQTLKGYPVASFWLYKTNGIFQSDAEAAAYVNDKGERLQPDATAGDIRFVDVNKDGVIDADDKVYSGSGIPKVEANLSFSGAYKGFDLSFQLGSAWGHKLYNVNRLYYEGMDAGRNYFTTTLNAWTPDNTNTDMPRAVLGDPNNNTRESDRFLENGNFVRLRQLQLGYTLPQAIAKKCFLEKCRIYVSGENLFTITGYSGIDPEFSSSILDTGVDSFVYPFTRSYVVGLQVTF